MADIIVTADDTEVAGITGSVSYTAVLSRPGGGADGATYIFPTPILDGEGVEDVDSYNEGPFVDGTGPADAMLFDVFVQQGEEEDFVYDGGVVSAASASVGGGLSAPALVWNGSAYEATLTWFSFAAKDYDASAFGGPNCTYAVGNGEGGEEEGGGDAPEAEYVATAAAFQSGQGSGTGVPGQGAVAYVATTDRVYDTVLRYLSSIIEQLEEISGPTSDGPALVTRITAYLTGQTSGTLAGGVQGAGKPADAASRILILDGFDHVASVAADAPLSADTSAISTLATRVREGRLTGVLSGGSGELIGPVTEEMFNDRALELVELADAVLGE